MKKVYRTLTEADFVVDNSVPLDEAVEALLKYVLTSTN
jgi:hypothetical protein